MAQREIRRCELPATGGLGVHFTTPKKRRRPERKKKPVVSYTAESELKQMESKLAMLRKKASAAAKEMEMDKGLGLDPAPGLSDMPTSDNIQADESDWYDEGGLDAMPHEEPSLLDSLPPKRLTPDQRATDLYEKWRYLVPALVKPLLKYMNATSGKEWIRPAENISSECQIGGECPKTTHRVTALLFGSFMNCEITACLCHSLPQVLVRNGLFPTAPSSPRQVISLELLELFLALTERSSDAVTAIAIALNNTYRARGFIAQDSRGNKIKEPFRKGIGYAMQWYDCVCKEIERCKEAAISAKLQQMFATPNGALSPNGGTADEESPPVVDTTSKAPTTLSETLPLLSSSSAYGNWAFATTTAITDPSASTDATTPDPPPENVAAIHRFLQKRCPTCFGMFLSKLNRVHCAFDCNFSQRHLRAAANCPPFYQPIFFVSKEEVDRAGRVIENARKRPVPRHNPVPDEAIDTCVESHDAGTGSTVKASMEKFDIGGLAALVCRHNIPLFVANVDTPGEQQKYAVALIEHLFALLPRAALVTVLYDVGCVLDRSMSKYEIFSDGIPDRLEFATSAMHAYVHQWACQLHYNPRLKTGLGLTDGEGVERLWSRMRRLIPVCRTSAAHRRTWLIDRQLGAISDELREDLGGWIRRRFSKGIEAQTKALLETLAKCGVDKATLRQQWSQQKEVQLSLRAHAPERLKKELDHILRLQADLDGLGSTIEKTASLIKSGFLPDSCHSAMGTLQTQLGSIQQSTQTMYASLNVSNDFPTLAGVDLNFVRKLFLIRELKAIVQKRATSAFWEFDKLDRAAGGKDMILGTKMHQHVRGAMTKKTASLNKVILRYNQECEHLTKMRRPGCKIPVPEPLPTKIADLRQCSSLMESIWIAPVDSGIHRWVHDPNVRDGIRAMLKLERCVEERTRLGEEADNLFAWYKRELAALSAAIRDPANGELLSPLRREYEEIASLSIAWASPWVPQSAFEAYAAALKESTAHVFPLTWAPVTVAVDAFEEGAENDEKVIAQYTAEDKWPPEYSSEDILLQDLAIEQEHEEEETPATFVLPVIFATPLAPPCTLRWTLPESLVVDQHLFRDLTFQHVPRTGVLLPRVLCDSANRRVAIFGNKELKQLKGATSLVNDECINGIAILLQQALDHPASIYQPSAHRCAIFTSHNLSLARHDSDDIVFWRHTERAEYWTKDVWILPIYRDASTHWVLAVIVPLYGQIFLFDSFAREQAWICELPDIMRFIYRLKKLANQNGYDLLGFFDQDWGAQPVVVEPVQSNAHDCGIWVLACIASVLRGYHAPVICEADIPYFRDLLLQHVLALPLSPSH